MDKLVQCITRSVRTLCLTEYMRVPTCHSVCWCIKMEASAYIYVKVTASVQDGHFIQP